MFHARSRCVSILPLSSQGVAMREIVRAQFRKNMFETDPEKIAEMKKGYVALYLYPGGLDHAVLTMPMLQCNHCHIELPAVRKPRVCVVTSRV